MQSYSTPSNESYQLVIDILANLVKEAMASYDSSGKRKPNTAASTNEE